MRLSFVRINTNADARQIFATINKLIHSTQKRIRSKTSIEKGANYVIVKTIRSKTTSHPESDRYLTRISHDNRFFVSGKAEVSFVLEAVQLETEATNSAGHSSTRRSIRSEKECTELYFTDRRCLWRKQ